MQDNVYAAPQARVADLAIRVPADITEKIRGAVIAGCIAAGMQAVLVAMALLGKPLMGVDAWGSIDLAIVLALVYGVHRKSRTCAVLLLLLFIAGRISMMVDAGRPTGIVITLIFLYYYGRGVAGTFQYQAFMRDPAARAKFATTSNAATSERIAAIEATRSSGQERESGKTPVAAESPT